MPSALSRRLDRIEAASGARPGRAYVLDSAADEARLRAALGFPEDDRGLYARLRPPPEEPEGPAARAAWEAACADRKSVV